MNVRRISRIGGLVIGLALIGLPTVTAMEVREGVKFLTKEDVKVKPGDVITTADWDKMKDLIPDGYEPFIRWDGMRIEVQPTGDYTPHKAYIDATEKFSSQTKLGPSGELLNYVAGFPFAPWAIDPQDPQAGWKFGWDFNWNPRGIGLELTPVEWRIIKKGTMVRRMESYYWRLYFSHKPDYIGMPDTALPGATGIEWKEYNWFYTPFDVKDTKLILHRYLDPGQDDDSWFYAPAFRRTRRLAATQKSDSLLGTEAALDDFWGYTGKIERRSWRYLGETRVLGAMNIEMTESSDYGGPQGWYPLYHRYEVREVYVVEAKPVDTGNPYSRSVLYLDKEQLNNLYTQHYDRDGKLWKGWQVTWNWSEESPIAENHGKRVPLWTGPNCINVQSMTTLSAPCHNPIAKGATPEEAEASFSLNRLKQEAPR